MAAVCIGVLGVLVYANSFSAPLVFDGKRFIVENSLVREPGSFWAVLTGTNRPVAVLSFAADYAVHGEDVWGYHAVNLGIHLAAALALFGIMRRTLSRGSLAARYGQHAGWLAMAVAAIWLVHPLQTQSVTYVYQRFESLMGLFFLLTIYLFVRAQDSRHGTWWYAGSVLCCLLAIGSKEVAVMLPLVLLWYDRVFLCASWRELVRARWKYYAVLGGLLGVGAAMVVNSMPLYRGGGVLFVEGVSPIEYALSQPGVILHYVRLAFWPQGQCLDYAWPTAQTFGGLALPLIGMAILLGATAWCAIRRPALGFLGGAFFVILTPTSSIFPIRDLCFEHRMYLPLAAVVAAVVVSGYELLRRIAEEDASGSAAQGGNGIRQNARVWSSEESDSFLRFGVVIVVACVAALSVATMLRNDVYRSKTALWSDVAAKAPHNGRAHLHLGNALRSDDPVQAVEHYRAAVKYLPNSSEAHNNLGGMLARNQPEAAIPLYRRALELEPGNADAHNNLANALARLGQYDDAVRHYREALRLQPGHRNASRNVEVVLAMQREAAGGRQGRSPTATTGPGDG